MTAARWATLPCGQDPARLITYAADRTATPSASHEAACRYCQAAIGELTDLWQPVADWARRDTKLPYHFYITIMSAVRRLVQSPAP